MPSGRLCAAWAANAASLMVIARSGEPFTLNVPFVNSRSSPETSSWWDADGLLLRVPGLAPLRLLGPQAVEVEQLEEPIERGVVVARVDRQPGGHRVRELLDEVLAPQLERIQLQLACQSVDRPLEHVGR